MSVAVPLHGKYGTGKCALVDELDVERVQAHRWFLSPAGYVQRSLGDKTTILLHRFILNALAGERVDHEDLDRLNCTRSNLRIATHSQNCANTRVRRHSRSGLKGVRFHKKNGLWQARIRVNGQTRYLGYFASPAKAAEAYDEAARQHFGPFSRLNFPKQGEHQA